MRPTPKQIKMGLSEDRNGWKPPLTRLAPPKVQTKPATRRGN